MVCVKVLLCYICEVVTRLPRSSHQHQHNSVKSRFKSNLLVTQNLAQKTFRFMKVMQIGMPRIIVVNI